MASIDIAQWHYGAMLTDDPDDCSYTVPSGKKLILPVLHFRNTDDEARTVTIDIEYAAGAEGPIVHITSTFEADGDWGSTEPGEIPDLREGDVIRCSCDEDDLVMAAGSGYLYTP